MQIIVENIKSHAGRKICNLLCEPRNLLQLFASNNIYCRVNYVYFKINILSEFIEYRLEIVNILCIYFVFFVVLLVFEYKFKYTRKTNKPLLKINLYFQLNGICQKSNIFPKQHIISTRGM
jgi:hypothetical protein